MPKLLLIAAVETELRTLHAQLNSARRVACARRTAWQGQLHGQEVLLVASGIGKVNAAAATAVALEQHAPHGVISFGSAGAYLDSGLQVGDLLLARDEVLADEGVDCGDRFLDLEALGFPAVATPHPAYNRFAPPSTLLKRAEEVLSKTAARLAVRLQTATALTVSSCSGTSARGALLARRWQGSGENMEGGAVAQVCCAWGVPWLEVRGISNLVVDRDLSGWDLPRAGKHAQEAVADLVEYLDVEEWTHDRL